MNIDETFKNKTDEFEKIIDYSFKNKDYLFLALSHSSFANEDKKESLKSNERLEFLGDALLNVVISEKLFNDYKNLAEGDLTKIRANIVCESSLAKCAKNISIGDYLLLGKGEETSGGRRRVSILSDACEALFGAIYCDSGMKEVKKFILKHMKDIIIQSASGNIFYDYKSQLQESVQKNGETVIEYELIDEKGPDHNKLFTVRVKVNENVLGTGNGRTKKEAEMNAAKSALEDI
ncbi:MAG: ribonuclease III [Clostridia bacterium]|jgi:ribonuclease-3